MTNQVQEFYDGLVDAVQQNKNVNNYIQEALNLKCHHKMINVLKITRRYSHSASWKNLLESTRQLIVRTLRVSENKANEIIGL